jgi:hypothetical protein
MILVAVRFRFLALFFSLLLLVVAAGPARADIIAQYAFGGDTGEVTMGMDLSGRSGIGWEATTSDVNVTANNAYLSDSIPPSSEDYIEFTSPSYVDANGNNFPVLRFVPGNNSNSPAEAVQKDKYFAFQVTAGAGFVLNLTSLTFDAGRGGDAPPRGWVVLSDVDGFTNIIDTQEVMTTRPTLTSYSIDLSGPQYQGLTEITLRIYTYLPGGGRSIEYHNVTLNGKVQ